MLSLQHPGMSLLSDLLQSIIDMPGEFAEVATQGSILDTLLATTLLLVGALLVIVSSLFFGYLLAGAAVDLLVPDRSQFSYP